MPGCCHRIVKHYPIRDEYQLAYPKNGNYLPASSQVKHIDVKIELYREYWSLLGMGAKTNRLLVSWACLGRIV